MAILGEGNRHRAITERRLDLDNERVKIATFICNKARESSFSRIRSLWYPSFVIASQLSSLDYHREIKLPLYALAGIQEYWSVNLNDSKVEVYRQPQSTGIYRSRVDFARGETLIALAFPEAYIEVDAILGAFPGETVN